MKAAQSGPLLLMGAALGGWLLLRGSFVAWTATGGVPPPSIIAQRLPPASLPSGPLMPLPLNYGDPAVLAQLPDWDTAAVAAGGRSQVEVRRGAVRTDDGHAASNGVALATGSGLRRLQLPPADTRPAPRDNAIIGAQSLLLARMLSPRPHHDGRPTYLGPTLTSRNADRAFVPAGRPGADRWSLAAALFLRRGPASPALGPGAQLGGSQAYARLGWQADAAGTEIFARVNSAGRLDGGAEAAVGVATPRLAALPVRLIVERRQRVAGEGRSAFAVYAVGGADAQRGDWRLQTYGAAGVVGAARSDAFVEGAATIARPVARIGPLELTAGGGAWGAAQPGASRLDIGPVLTARSERIDGARFAVDWRQRVSGDAAPPSGPALTLSVDF